VLDSNGECGSVSHGGEEGCGGGDKGEGYESGEGGAPGVRGEVGEGEGIGLECVQELAR